MDFEAVLKAAEYVRDYRVREGTGLAMVPSGYAVVSREYVETAAKIAAYILGPDTVKVCAVKELPAEAEKDGAA